MTRPLKSCHLLQSVLRYWPVKLDLTSVGVCISLKIGIQKVQPLRSLNKAQTVQQKVPSNDTRYNKKAAQNQIYTNSNHSKKGMVLTLLHTKCILMTKYQFSHQCLHGWGNPITQELEKEPNNAQMPIPTQQEMKSPTEY